MENGVERISRYENICVSVSYRVKNQGSATRAFFNIRTNNADEGFLRQAPLPENALPETREFAIEFTEKMKAACKDTGISISLLDDLIATCSFADLGKLEAIVTKVLEEYHLKPKFDRLYQSEATPKSASTRFRAAPLTKNRRK